MKEPPRRALVVLGHGRAESLCHHLTRVILDGLDQAGVEHRVHDLLADGFDPVLRIPPGRRFTSHEPADGDQLLRRYQDVVAWADLYIVVHPVWWFSPPAILKGWIDRVFVDGVALERGQEGPPHGVLEGRRALVVQTFGVPRAVHRVAFLSLASLFWKRAVFASVGVRSVRNVALYSVENLTDKRLARQLEGLRRALRKSL